jgi:hypothetical protein
LLAVDVEYVIDVWPATVTLKWLASVNATWTSLVSAEPSIVSKLGV